MRTHCKNGHELTPENSRITTTKGRSSIACWTCRRQYNRDRKARLRMTPAGRAYKRVEMMLYHGSLTRLPCQECGAEPADAHHPRGYEGDAALDIEWLCPTHHKARHPGKPRAAVVLPPDSDHAPHLGNHVGYACGFTFPHCWECAEPWPCRASRGLVA